MKSRALSLSAIAVLGSFALTGCSSSNSEVTIDYGDGQSVNATFTRVECTEVSASAVTIDPTHASITVHFDAAQDDYHGSSWVYADALVLFEADHLEVSRDGDQVRVSGEGEVQIAQRAEGEPLPGEGFDTGGAEQTSGTISAELSCTD